MFSLLTYHYIVILKIGAPQIQHSMLNISILKEVCEVIDKNLPIQKISQFGGNVLTTMYFQNMILKVRVYRRF